MARSRTRIEWRGNAQLRQAMHTYGQRVRDAELQVARYWAAVVETDARNTAPWTDRTANARQALRGYTSEDIPEKFGAQEAAEYPTPTDLARDVVALYLSHGMQYGLYLETRWQGRYAVIMPTLQKHYPAISRMLRDIFA